MHSTRSSCLVNVFCVPFGTRTVARVRLRPLARGWGSRNQNPAWDVFFPHTFWHLLNGVELSFFESYPLAYSGPHADRSGSKRQGAGPRRVGEVQPRSVCRGARQIHHATRHLIMSKMLSRSDFPTELWIHHSKPIVANAAIRPRANSC